MTGFGVCNWIFGGEPLPQTAARLAHLGYDGVELYGDMKLKPAEVNRILSEHGLRVISITPENEDILHPDETIRARGIDYYLRLLDYAKQLVGAPIMCCHGAVGRIRPVASYAEEWSLYIDAVRKIGKQADDLGVNVAMEVLNRYEAHFLLTAAEAVRFVEEVGAARVGILLDAYHMNIEEADLRSALFTARQHLRLFHVADSNRAGVGRGHTDWIGVFRTLRDIGYAGDIVVENVAPGPDPFTPLKGDRPVEWIETYLAESLDLIKTYQKIA